MGFISFNQLLEKYITELEKESTRNQECHPTFTLLKNAYRNITFYSYLIYFTFFLFGLLIIAPFFLDVFEFLTDHLLWNLAYVSFMVLIIIAIGKIFKFPYLNDLWALGDRVTLVRGKIQLSEFDLEFIKEMILEKDKIFSTEAYAHLERYHQLIKPTIDGNKNKDINSESNPLERLIAFNLFLQRTQIKYGRDEYLILLSSLLRISKSDLPNVNTDLKLINKILGKEELDKKEKEQIDILATSLKKTAKLLDETSKNALNNYNILIQSK